MSQSRRAPRARATALLGVPYYLPLGLMMAVLGILPYVGSVLGGTLVVAATFLTSGLKSGIIALVVGFGAIAGGIFGAWYTWDQAVAQDVTTPDDAAIPEATVRGPFTMWAQSDIITHHQLDSTEGLYYSQMDREVPAVDENGEAVLDENGEPVQPIVGRAVERGLLGAGRRTSRSRYRPRAPAAVAGARPARLHRGDLPTAPV